MTRRPETTTQQLSARTFAAVGGSRGRGVRVVRSRPPRRRDGTTEAPRGVLLSYCATAKLRRRVGVESAAGEYNPYNITVSRELQNDRQTIDIVYCRSIRVREMCL